MRVIAGQKRGKKLDRLKDEAVRPTTDKVKESIFNVIQFDVAGASFLDLFAGSGQIGIEALSRDARQATFVDENRDAINVIKRNLTATDFMARATVVNMDSALFLKKQDEGSFDIAFLDPPYRSEVLDVALLLLPRVIAKGGIIICEHPAALDLPISLANFRLTKAYKYGKIAVSVYRD